MGTQMGTNDTVSWKWPSLSSSVTLPRSPCLWISWKYHCSVSETQARQLSPVIDSISSVSFDKSALWQSEAPSPQSVIPPHPSHLLNQSPSVPDISPPVTDSVICFHVDWFWTECLESAESCREDRMKRGLPCILLWWCCGKSQYAISQYECCLPVQNCFGLLPGCCYVVLDGC